MKTYDVIQSARYPKANTPLTNISVGVCAIGLTLDEAIQKAKELTRKHHRVCKYTPMASMYGA